jgi:integrase
LNSRKSGCANEWDSEVADVTKRVDNVGPLAEPRPSVRHVLTIRFSLGLAAAGIHKEDERGRRVDLHALRHTFGTRLSKNGVAPRTAQAAMRHSSIGLTMNVYTDPTLLDAAGAMAALPELRLGGEGRADVGRAER